MVEEVEMVVHRFWKKSGGGGGGGGAHLVLQEGGAWLWHHW